MPRHFIDMTPEEQRLFQRAWKRIRRTLHGAIINQIHCHGPITTGHMPSVMKRVSGQLKEPVAELVNTLLEEKREVERKARNEDN